MDDALKCTSIRLNFLMKKTALCQLLVNVIGSNCVFAPHIELITTANPKHLQLWKQCQSTQCTGIQFDMTITKLTNGPWSRSCVQFMTFNDILVNISLRLNQNSEHCIEINDLQLIPLHKAYCPCGWAGPIMWPYLFKAVNMSHYLW